MILPSKREELPYISGEDCRITILERRRSIRSHRDQRGDNRCFLDDYLLWKWLRDSPPEPRAETLIGRGMEQCTLFYEHRRAEVADVIPIDAILDSIHWDDDLRAMTSEELRSELDLPPNKLLINFS